MATRDAKLFRRLGPRGGSAELESASSILPIQFAPGLSSSAGHRHHLDRESFSLLRQELLQGHSYNNFRSNENIKDVNKLICVIMKAGLEHAIKDDSPPSNEMEEQIFNYLDTLKVAIEKAPQALLENPDPDIFGTDVHAPLFTWLVIQLVNLRSNWNQEDIEGRIRSLLSHIVCSQHKSWRTRGSRFSISAFIQAFATDIIVSLESSVLSKSLHSEAFTISVPSQNGNLLLDLERTGLPCGLFRNETVIASFSGGVSCSLLLVDSIILNSGHDCSSIGTSHSFGWALNLHQRLWKVIFEWIRTPASSSVQCKANISAMFLTNIHSFNRCTTSGVVSLNVKTMCILLQSMADLLSVESLCREPPLQTALCRCLDSLMNTEQQTIAIVLNILLPTLSEIRRHSAIFSKYPTPFQEAISKLLDKTLQGGHTIAQDSECNSPQPHDPDNPNCIQNDIKDGDVSDTGVDGRAKKRIRLSPPQSEPSTYGLLQGLLQKTYIILELEDCANMGELSRAISQKFSKLSQEKKSELLKTIGRIPCAHAGYSLNGPRNILKEGPLWCNLCEDSSGSLDTMLPSPTPGFEELRRAFSDIIPVLPRSTTVRIASMFSLRHLLIHESDGEQLRVDSRFGEFCLHSLRSSCRELRLVSGHVLTIFVRASLDSELRRSNFVVILERLRNISERKEIPLQETCIITLCKLAEISGDEELHIILLHLAEYLGHANPYICAVAYTELAKLSQHLSMKPAGLFRPFWRTISVAVVRNLQTRPHMAEQLCYLLGMEVDNFLRLTEVHILPYLVLMRKRDVIMRIGATYQTTKTPFDLCSEKNNLASILAYLLSQPSPHPEDMIVSLFGDVDPTFRKHTLADLVRTEPILIACELLKGLGDARDGKESMFYRALDLLASFVPRKSAQGTSNIKRQNGLGNFIEEHILGIITEFGHTINDFKIRQPISEKKRGIIAIGEMIKIAPSHISSALPQICACLRSALDIKELCDHAFAVWSTLISSLDNVEVEPLVDQTLAIIIRCWEKFQRRSKARALELIEYILKTHGDLVRRNCDIMPSLSSIPALEDFERQICELKADMDIRAHFMAFVRRCQSENAVVIEQALNELVLYLAKHEGFLHVCVLNEQPDPVVALLARSLLDCCIKFKNVSVIIMNLSARCLGLIGCLDPNRVETVKEKRDILVLSNFERMEETFEFALFFLQYVLVDAFLSASNTRAQGFLAYAMQSLLKISKLNAAVPSRPRNIEPDEKYQRWLALPEVTRNVLAPFLTSKYTVTIGAVNTSCTYPLFSPTLNHGEWLRTFVQDLLQKGERDNNLRLIFSVCSRIIRGQDIAISSFLLPFAVLNLALNGIETQKRELQNELTKVLSNPLPDGNSRVRENVIFCSESVFNVLDYLSRWLQGKKKQYAALAANGQINRPHENNPLDICSTQIRSVEQLLSSIPPEIISKRAVECKSFSRALFHWEQYIRQCRTLPDKKNTDFESLYQRLQDIYAEIDEPDGIEGISAQLHVLNIDQQILEHRKTGRWVAAQSWYELQLNSEHNNSENQWHLLTCLRESGQQDALLNQFEDFKRAGISISRFLPLAIEACWVTRKWVKLGQYVEMCSKQNIGDFNVGIGSALNALHHRRIDVFKRDIDDLRNGIAKSLTANSVASLQSCHSSLLHLHALAEVEAIAYPGYEQLRDGSAVLEILDRRLDVLGGYLSEKQYILGLRRAAMELSTRFSDPDIAAVWLTGARLLRKGNCTGQAYHSVLHAARLKDKSAIIEHARLLWKDSHHRKAIQTLKGAIKASTFISHNYPSGESTSMSIPSDQESHQNMLTARAHLLLAKWTDRAGQTQSDVIVQRYREAIKLHTRWEKAHCYLGKHYNKILESERAKPFGKEAQTYLNGEASKLVIDNYLRSLAHGNKYVFQTLPKILTLWLDHASIVDQPFDSKRGDNEEFQKHSMAQRKKSLDGMHVQLKKYLNRMPAGLLFTILPQVVARICHPNSTVSDLLSRIVVKTVSAFPQQSLWTVLALVKSSSKDRTSRGLTCLQRITDTAKKSKSGLPVADMSTLINQAQKFSEELLRLCIAKVEDKMTKISLARHLGFNSKVAPCRLVVPFQTMLTPSLPAKHEPDYLKTFRAFPRETVTIDSINDEALVLNSLQKPRKITVRGSDGRSYNLLCKPKDDLRKDQRLMEFNNMINRFLKKDMRSSKRRMYIKTYAVTPLNEECGLIEWVDNLRTLREIVLKLLRERGITPNYNDIRRLLDEACSDASKLPLFTSEVLARFPPVLHEWFVEMFPEPGAWFAARLRYTRSCAVMSMVGYVLGLGDRHGENILFEEGSGGVLHVDFNCLFDKGSTFDKPELVPFRLTHNMTDAFGAYGYNGPFRKTCEISLNLLRENEDALMTILETFLHDPTTDFIGKKKRTSPNVPETPEGVLECVRNKLRGLLPGESVPLSVDGHVDELILQATSKKNLAAMYIGWCPFF